MGIISVTNYYIIQKVESDPVLTLKQMSAFVLDAHNKSLAPTSIARYLHNRVFTYKSNHYEPLDMNCESKKEMRQIYLLKLLEFMAQGNLGMNNKPLFYFNTFN